MVLAAELAPPGMLVELETEPLPAWMLTDEPPAVLLPDTPPPDELTELPDPAELLAPEPPLDDELMVEPPEAPAAVMLPSALRLTVTVQVWPAAFLPCFVMVSAWAEVPAPTAAAATALTSTKSVVVFMAPLPKESGRPRGRPH
jgi:hypothetical protein